MALIKDIYSEEFYKRLAASLNRVLPSFSTKKFMDDILVKDFKQMEWKERVKHTTRVLHTVMPPDFTRAVAVIEKLIADLKKSGSGDDNLVFMFFPDYIETYGLDHFPVAVKALKSVTRFISCEFSVRPFIIRYGQQMIDEMVKWSLDPDSRVRRLASEGSRPRLPWAMALPALKADPGPILPILENLKNDPSETVRRSVANSLNDITKDHPDVVLSIAVKWRGHSKETDAIIKHGSRTLLKQGHTEILAHYGLNSADIRISKFTIVTPAVKIGGRLAFDFCVANKSTGPQTIRLEYVIYYKKSRGHLTRKVFKISERTYQPGESANISRQQSFKLITTRTFHPGVHQLAIITNGREHSKKDFELMK